MTTQKQTQKQGTLRTTSARQAERRERTRETRQGAGRVIAAYSRYCSAHSVPTPSRFDIGIFSTQAANLLAGGYDEAEVTEEALTIATEFSLVFGHRGMTQLQRRVQQKYEDRRIEEHEAVVGPSDPAKRRQVRVVAPDVAAVIGGVKHMPAKHEPRDPRPVRASLPPLAKVVSKCSCGHYSVEHGKSGCQTCERIGKACAA